MCGSESRTVALSPSWEEIRFQKAITQIAEATGEEHPDFEDHTPFSNRGMKDLLKLDELVSTV